MTDQELIAARNRIVNMYLRLDALKEEEAMRKIEEQEEQPTTKQIIIQLREGAI